MLKMFYLIFALMRLRESAKVTAYSL